MLHLPGQVIAHATKKVVTRVASDPKVQKRVAAAGIVLIDPTAKAVSRATKGLRESRKARSLARKQARSTGGMYSVDTVCLGQTRCIVWKSGEPVSAYPIPAADLLDGRELKDLEELKDFDTTQLLDPNDNWYERRFGGDTQ